jgi:hypothetical protein
MSMNLLQCSEKSYWRRKRLLCEGKVHGWVEEDVMTVINREVKVGLERETTTKAKAVEGGIIALATTTTISPLDFGLQGTC